jgi:hypothetical protein
MSLVHTLLYSASPFHKNWLLRASCNCCPAIVTFQFALLILSPFCRFKPFCTLWAWAAWFLIYPAPVLVLLLNNFFLLTMVN